MSESRSVQANVDTDAATMAAVVAPEYGGSEVLRVESHPIPVPGAGEVLVRVRAASVCKGDVHLLTGKPYPIRLMGFGLRRPKHRVIGHDLAGEVVATGPGVTEFRSGERVFGAVTAGAFAGYAVVPVATLAPIPAGITVEQAAAVPDSGATALQGLRDVGGLTAGQRVLINGASGGVGSFAVQIAKSMGAEVTAVCSTRHLEMVRGLGADHVIDYTTEDFATLDRKFDVLLDLVGNRRLRDCVRILTPTGTLVSSAGAPGGDLVGPLIWLGQVVLADLCTRRTLRPLLMRQRRADLDALAESLARGEIRPVIERTHPLREAAAAIRHLHLGHAQGKTVLLVEHP